MHFGTKLITQQQTQFFGADSLKIGIL